jgi:hypothetical protein
VRKRLGLLLVVAVAGIALVAAVDALRGSSESTVAPGSNAEPHGPSLATPEPRPPTWPAQLRRTLRIAEPVGASWEEIGALDPGSYALSARFNLPHDADVDVWFESVTGSDTIDLLGRGQPRDCRVEEGRDICTTALDFSQSEAEVLRLLARKMSKGSMVVRLRIVFEQTSETASPLPRCKREQLALSVESVGDQSGVALRHVQRPACQLTSLPLRVFVTDRKGKRQELGLGDEAELGGVFSPGLERIVPFSVCGEGAPFVAEARAGPYSARGPAKVGGQNCDAAVRTRVFRFGDRPEERRVNVEALDPALHPLTVRINLPRSADVELWMQTGSGHKIELRVERSDCQRHATRALCVIRYGLFEGNSAGVWSLHARKWSLGAARVRVSVAFGPVALGQG